MEHPDPAGCDQGNQQFGDFQESLRIPPSSLAKRLEGLVEKGLLESRQYSSRPVRHEHLLTRSGRDFLPVIVALYTWGLTHSPPEILTLMLADRRDGHEVDPIMIDRHTGIAITDETVGFRAGPDADHYRVLTRTLESHWELRSQS